VPTQATSDAVAVVEAATEYHFDEIVDRFPPAVRAMVTADILRATWESATSRLGTCTGVGQPFEEPATSGVVLVRVPVTFADGGLTVLVSLATSGDLVGVQLAPPGAMAPQQQWQPASCVDTSSFTEHDVVLGEDALAVPGMVTVPRGDRQRPAVVLLAGSGPNDRDGTIGPSKPLKDLAWGLAGRGIAALRFDKVTHTHPAEVLANPAFTALDEYQAATLAAIAELRDTPGVDPDRIVLLGHSLGGTIAPRIATDVTGLAGLVLCAAGAQPMYWSAVRQVRHLADLDSATSAAAAPVIAAMTEQARRVDDPGLTARTPANLLPFGQPAPYWLDLRDYDQVGTAAALSVPMLVLNGGRDYQATIADDLALWRAGLRHRDGVTVREYPADNHFFFPGDQPSTPEEYLRLHHVDDDVVADVADWIHGLG
jgi:dienelactone hydrolase